MMTLRETALRYGGAGWKVIPLHSAPDGRCTCGNLNCPSPGKHPRTPNGLKDASADPAVIGGWWSRWQGANIGGIPGSAGYIFLDIDPPEGEANAAKLGLLREPTPQVITGRGRHLVFKHPGFPVSNRALATNVDNRGDAGYCVLPCSVHVSGHTYRWIGKLADATELPDAVLEILRPTTGTIGVAVPAAALEETIAEGERNRALASLAGTMRRRGMAPEEIIPALLAVNARRCRPPLPGEEVYRIGESVGRYTPAALQPTWPVASVGDDTPWSGLTPRSAHRWGAP